MSDSPIRIDVLTGFLGSGKTTLLRRLIEAGALTDTAFLINEFADLPLDAILLQGAERRIGVFAGSCICCAVDGALKDALVDMLSRRDSGALPPFRRILVETSGIAEPAPVLSTILNDGFLQALLTPGRIIATLDATTADRSLADYPEALAQLAAADALVLTKTDLTDEDPAAFWNRLGWLNPLATRLDGEARPDLLASILNGATLPHGPTLPARPYARPDDRAEPRHGVQACRLHWPEPVDWPGFSLWLSALLHRHGDRVLRVKGLINLQGTEGDGALLIQAVRHAVHPPEHLPGIPAPPGADIVVIARDLDPALLQRSFAAFQGLPNA